MLEDPLATRAFCADWRTDPESVVRAARRPRRALRLNYNMGSRIPGDIIWAWLYLVMSERVCEILRDAEVSGWGAVPVDLRGKLGETIEGYSLLTIPGQCGPIDTTRGAHVKAYGSRGFAEMRGLYFDPASWDGSDIFMPRSHHLYIFVVERVRKLLEQHRVGNIRYTRADECIYFRPSRSS